MKTSIILLIFLIVAGFTKPPLQFKRADIVRILNSNKYDKEKMYFYSCNSTGEIVDYHYYNNSIVYYKINFSCYGIYLDFSEPATNLELIKRENREDR